MSLKCITMFNASHFSMLPHSMAENTNFSEINSLKHEYASMVHGTSNCLSVSKQNNSNGIQEARKLDILGKSQNLASQTVLSNINGNYLIEESSVKKMPNGAHSLRVCTVNNEITTLNVISNPTYNPFKATSNGTSKQNCSTGESLGKKASSGTQSLDSCMDNKIHTVDVISVAASNPSKTASNGTSKQMCSVNSNGTVLSVENSSPTRAETNRVLEGCGFIDLHENTDSSKATDSSDQGSRVVVQRLSNVSCGQESFLDSCFNINEILEKKPCEKKWCPGDVVESNEQNYESTRCSMNGNKEKTSDVCHEENLSSKVSSTRKMRKNHEMNFHIRPGNGIRLRDIANIVSNVEKASPPLLSFLHKVLFGSYGGSNNEDALSQTKQNILHFSGFPFSEDSEIFQIKRKCLSKVPYPMLLSICNTLLGKGPRTRNDSVEDLLTFLQTPTNNSKREQQLETSQMTFAESEITQLEQQAVKGPYPIILLPKLSDSYVKELLQKMRGGEPEVDSSSKLSDMETMIGVETIPKDVKTIPEVGLPNNTIRLKALPEVVVRVNKARRRTINLLHTLLYGRPGSEEVNRLNILEFSGFTHYDAKTYRRKKEFLYKLRINDLNHMCSIFSLRMKSFSKMDKVIKFLHHLKAPSLTTNSKKTTKLRPQNKETIDKKTEVYSERKTKSYEQPIKKLKDFEKICRNIECASPKDLTELNDLLFLKPADNLEIHQQILEFSSSSFRENSPDFYSRRTLLYYMSFEIIKKMAALLEITDWEEYKNPQDLASTLLRFVMDMKPSVKIRQKIKPVHRLRRKVPSSLTHRPHLLRVQRDDSGWESNVKGNLNTSPSAMHNSIYVKEGFHEERGMQDTSVIVRRISESSYSFTDTRTNEPVTVSDSNSDESLSLYDFIKHPSDKQLEVTIREMVFTATWSSSMGDLINKVFHCYPKLNLTYRVDFIKAKALEVLHEIQYGAPFGDVI